MGSPNDGPKYSSHKSGVHVSLTRMLTDPTTPSEGAPAVEDSGSSRLEQVLQAFDDLVEQDAGPVFALARTARLLGRGVGVCTPDGERLVAGPDGVVRQEAGTVPDGARQLPDGLRVWLEGRPWPEERLLLRRLGVTMKAALRQSDGAAVPAIEVVFDERRSPAARLRAAGNLGLREDAPLTVMGIKGREEDVKELASRINKVSSRVHGYDDGSTLFLAVEGLEDALPTVPVPVGVRAALARNVQILELPEKYKLVRLGMRYTLPAAHDSAPYHQEEAVFLDAATMGGYALLPQYLTADQIDTVGDVQVLDELWTAHGADMLRILEAVAVTDSVRKAARSVYLHHNSVTHRVARAEQALGFNITEPYGRTRLFLALCLRRVRDSDE